MDSEMPDEPFIPPWIHLQFSLETYEQDHEEHYRPPSTPQEDALHGALDQVAKHAVEILRTGRVPAELAARLEEYEPWRPLDQRIKELLWYNYVLLRVEFDVAWETVSRLKGSNKRIMVSIIAMHDLLKVTLSETALKYLLQVSELFLAGFTSAVFVMAGAVLEAAMRDRLPDEILLAQGMKPAYPKTGVFSIGQRMRLEGAERILTEGERERFWKVVNWRNDVVHVQPDVVPDPATVVLEVASLLARILPRESHGPDDRPREGGGR